MSPEGGTVALRGRGQLWGKPHLLGAYSSAASSSPLCMPHDKDRKEEGHVLKMEVSVFSGWVTPHLLLPAHITLLLERGEESSISFFSYMDKGFTKINNLSALNGLSQLCYFFLKTGN